MICGSALHWTNFDRRKQWLARVYNSMIRFPKWYHFGCDWSPCFNSLFHTHTHTLSLSPSPLTLSKRADRIAGSPIACRLTCCCREPAIPGQIGRSGEINGARTWHCFLPSDRFPRSSGFGGVRWNTNASNPLRESVNHSLNGYRIGSKVNTGLKEYRSPRWIAF